jgi:hypothetical protein
MFTVRPQRWFGVMALCFILCVLGDVSVQAAPKRLTIIGKCVLDENLE